MNKLDAVRALFVPGGQVECVENTYIPARNGARWNVETVGKTIWKPVSDENFRGTFPTRVGDVISVDGESATWKIGREDHTVTYRRVAA